MQRLSHFGSHIRSALTRLAVTFGFLALTACAGGFGGTASLPKLTITTQPQNQAVVLGQPATFTIVATGTGPITYQWSLNGTPISGATSATYTTPATAATDNGDVFSAVASNAAGPVTSTSAMLTVNTPPAITMQPLSQTVGVGKTATFTVAATGTAPLSYQWYLGGAVIVGATSPSYTTPGAFAGNSGGIYTVIVTNIAGSATSAPATLTVATPPTITVPPVGQSVTLGKTATFTVTATGTGPLTYQWYDGANPVSGATGPTYTTPATASTDNGSVFTVVVSNPAGSVTSSPATLTVNTPPAITVQPGSQSVVLGKTATFTVTATGTAPLTYQWSLGGTPIAGATSASYITPATVAGNSGGVYSVVVSNVAGTVTSSPATLTYQWYLGGTAISGATSTSYTTPATTVSNNGGLYTVTATNAAGSVTSAAATLTVISSAPTLTCSPTSPTYGATVKLTPTFGGGSGVIGSTGLNSSDITKTAASGTAYTSPAITANTTYTLTVTSGTVVTSATCSVTPTSVALTPITPANQTTAPAKQVFSTTATGGVTNTVTWTASGGTFSGGTFSGATWTPPNVAGVYTITATSVDNPAVSVSTTATIAIPVITTFPISQKVCLNGSATLTTAASYASSYQWSLNGTNIPCATNATLLIPNAIAIDSGTYVVTVTNGAGSATATAVLNVGSTITLNPTSLTVSPSQTATFNVAASGVSPFTYQWFDVPPAATSGVAITGATTSSYTTASVSSSASGTGYYATITDSCGTSLKTTTASLNVASVNGPPTITQQPVGIVTPAGGTAAFNVGAVGSPTLTYQWYRIPAGQTVPVAVAGATSTTYTVPTTNTQTANNEDTYYATVSNPYGLATSQPANLVIGTGILLQIDNQPVNDYVNPGDPGSFSVTATSTLPLTYQWYKANPGSSVFSPISGATGSTYTQATTATSDSGSVFKVVVSNGVSTLTSNSAALFVGALNGIPNFCNSGWIPLGNAISQTGCVFQLTAATTSQHGEIIWPNLIATGNIQLSFTISTSGASSPQPMGSRSFWETHRWALRLPAWALPAKDWEQKEFPAWCSPSTTSTTLRRLDSPAIPEAIAIRTMWRSAEGKPLSGRIRTSTSTPIFPAERRPSPYPVRRSRMRMWSPSTRET